MKYSQRLCLFAALCFLLCSVQLSFGQSILRIHQKDGKKIDVPLHDIDSVTHVVSSTGNLPTLQTIQVVNISSSKAETGGSIFDEGSSSILVRGVCWDTDPLPTTSDSRTDDGTGIGVFSSSLSSLSPGTVYFVRAYAVNGSGTSYGNQITFKTERIGTAPSITTLKPSNVTENSANAGGDITDDGGLPIVARGVCWSTDPNPTVSDSTTDDGSGTGTFSSYMAGLAPNTTYYLRAFATNGIATGYGDVVAFKTLIDGAIPTLSTHSIGEVSSYSAKTGGTISSDGNSSVNQYGVCWGTSTGPTTSGDKTNDGSGTGSFTSYLYNLTPNTTYYVRAYAINALGTAYGDELSFKSKDITATTATVVTDTVKNVSDTTAIVSGSITDNGGSSVTKRGFCWSTNSNPTVNDYVTDDGSGTGTYTSNISGLIVNTTYFLRAYAVNGVGVAYGNQMKFTTGVGKSKVIDYDGNIYSIVVIGSQEWLGENLKTTRYQNGDKIQYITDNYKWQNTSAGAWCYYDNDTTYNVPYGKLYNFYAVFDTRNICPSGWHVPSQSEWNDMLTYLGGASSAGGALKATGTYHWTYPNKDATNSSGFTAYPGGNRALSGTFNKIGELGRYWTETSAGASNNKFCDLDYSNSSVKVNGTNASNGMSVRCIKD
ncbi:MAG: hypothetical protein HYZ16_05815 [Bacteroidetes bacterium]|nr:hypothetical protein [Bacteroidota bacterium]